MSAFLTSLCDPAIDTGLSICILSAGQAPIISAMPSPAIQKVPFLGHPVFLPNDSQVEKFELGKEEYSKRTDTVQVRAQK